MDWEVITLENEYVKAQILPEIGGKLLRGFDKVGEHDFIYYNEVIKPALVGLAGAWISGGIEFNWPQHHRPTTFMPLEAAIENNPDGGKTVWVGEVEPFNRMKGMAGITLDPGRSYIKAKVRIYNRTPLPQVFMWWANLAVPANDNYRTVFPPDCEWVNDHDRRAVLEWPIAKGVYKTARPYDFGEGTDLSHYDAVKVPSSYLISQGQSDMDFIAGYDVGINKGIATVANHHIAPGKKMWHWGIGDFGDMWCNNLTDENGPYIELMTGVYTDNQPDFTWIAPYESREFEQYWYPIRDIGEIKNALLRRMKHPDAEKLSKEAADEDLLDLFSAFEYSHHTKHLDNLEQFAKKGENILDVVNDYLSAGMTDDALAALDLYHGEYPLIEYYRAYITGCADTVKKAEALDTGYCFPSRLEDIPVLEWAARVDSNAVNALYYLGCLYYDRFRCDEAAECWNQGLLKNPSHAKILRNLALYYFDKKNDAEKARKCLEKALLLKHDPRILYEYQQLIKNMNYTPEARLEVYEKYSDLLLKRDDCYLDKLTLVSQTGDFEGAIEMARIRRFHIYEGGEGKLTRQHAWMHLLLALELIQKEQFERAVQVLENGVNMPKSYGEAKTFFNQEAHIYLVLGDIFEKLDDRERAKKAFEEASVYKAAVSEISMFRALALKKLGRQDEAEKVLAEMLATADNFIVNKDLRSYYGVGSPSPLPFENDVEKNNLVDGNVLKAFALLGLGKKVEAEAAIDSARKIKPYDFRIFAFDKIK